MPRITTRAPLPPANPDFLPAPYRSPAARAETLRTRADILLSVGYAKAADILYTRASLIEWECTL